MRNWISKLIDPTASDVSLRHFGFLTGIVASVIWLTVDLLKRTPDGHWVGITGEWIAAYGLFLGAVTTSKIVGAQQAKNAAEVNAANDAGDPPAEAQEAPKE